MSVNSVPKVGLWKHDGRIDEQIDLTQRKHSFRLLLSFSLYKLKLLQNVSIPVFPATF
jgi:hypothetical protein